MGAGDGARHDERQAARVEGRARGDEGGEFFKERLGGLEGFGVVCEEVFARG